MARHPVKLPSISFNSKQEATVYFQKMLNRYGDGEDVSPDDDTILFELLQRHPEAEEKIGVGVKGFYRYSSPNHPTSCFHLERTDGSTTDFSFHSCISGIASTPRQLFYEACRHSVSKKLIHEKVQLFKDAGGTMVCAKTGAQIAIAEADYRHTSPSFREIVDDFIAVYGVEITPGLVLHGADMQYIATFADPDLAAMFQGHHAAKAKLAVFRRGVMQ